MKRISLKQRNHLPDVKILTAKQSKDDIDEQNHVFAKLPLKTIIISVLTPAHFINVL